MDTFARVAAGSHIANLAAVPIIVEPAPCTGCGFPLTAGACLTSWCDLAGGAR